MMLTDPPVAHAQLAYWWSIGVQPATSALYVPTGITVRDAIQGAMDMIESDLRYRNSQKPGVYKLTRAIICLDEGTRLQR